VHRLWPWPADREPTDAELSDPELERLYAFPETDRPWVCVNFVASADGAVNVAGHSAGLSDKADQKIFILGRDLSDVVLVGAGTVRAEDYGGIGHTERRDARRERAGLAGLPRIAVVSGRCALRPNSRLFTSGEQPPIVFTSERSPERDRAAVAEAGAEVVIAGTESVDPHRVVAELARHGMRRICCEGGPHLFGSLIAAGVVDEMRLTIAALLTGGDASRIAIGPTPDVPTGLRLASVSRAGDTLLLRYLSRR
jgi:riboflavin-specific deaminase-like protein